MFKIEKLILIVLLQVVFYTAHTQVNFKEATIIQLNGDTIKGEINYQEWVYNPKKIEFRDKKSQNVTTYSSKDIKGFTINYKNEQYQSAIIDVDNASLESSKLKEYEYLKDVEPNPQLTRDTAFLLIEAKGQLNLFSLQYTDGKPHYFVQKNNGLIEELKLRQVKIKRNDTISIVTFPIYKSQLQSLIADCTSQQQDFTKLLYLKNEILKVVKSYNVCKGQSFYIHKETSGQRRLLIFAGAALPLIIMGDDYYTESKPVQGNASPLFGIGFEQSYNRLRNKLAVGIDVNVANYKTDAKINYSLYDRVVHYKFNAISTKINPYVRYVFTTGTFQPYVKLGGGFLFYSNKTVERYYVEPSFEPVILRSYTLSKKRFETFGAAGLRIKNFFIESRYNFGIGNTLNGEDNVLIKQLSFSCGYSWNFNKDVAKK